jgi:ribosomal protein L11 methyltransferase
MDYNEIAIKITPNTQENREIITALLSNLPYDSFQDTENGVNAYIKNDDFNENELKQTLNYIDKNTINITYSINKIKSQNWNATWEANFEPVLINENCIIRAPFHKITPSPEYDIIIEPKMAFGTGHHQTTYLVSQELFETKLKNKTILDMGCGTGILSIIASKLGAKHITAIDNDYDAYKNTLENLKINNVKNAETLLGDAKTLSKLNNFDIIIANINRNILIQDIPEYSKKLQPNGKIILSGFYKKDLPLIIEKAGSVSLKLSGFRDKDNWIAASFIKN